MNKGPSPIASRKPSSTWKTLEPCSGVGQPALCPSLRDDEMETPPTSSENRKATTQGELPLNIHPSSFPRLDSVSFTYIPRANTMQAEDDMLRTKKEEAACKSGLREDAIDIEAAVASGSSQEIQGLLRLLDDREHELRVAATFGKGLAEENERLRGRIQQVEQENDHLSRNHRETREVVRTLRKRVDTLTRYVEEADSCNAALTERCQWLEQQIQRYKTLGNKRLSNAHADMEDIRAELEHQRKQAKLWETRAQSSRELVTNLQRHNLIIEKRLDHHQHQHFADEETKPDHRRAKSFDTKDSHVGQKTAQDLWIAGETASNYMQVERLLQEIKMLKAKNELMQDELRMGKTQTNEDVLYVHFHLTMQAVKYHICECSPKPKGVDHQEIFHGLDEQQLFEEALHVPTYEWYGFLRDTLANEYVRTFLRKASSDSFKKHASEMDMSSHSTSKSALGRKSRTRMPQRRDSVVSRWLKWVSAA